MAELNSDKPILKQLPDKYDKTFPYNCPTCGWEYPMDGGVFYIIRKARTRRHAYEITNYQRWNEEKRNVETNPIIASQIKETIYPIFSGGSSNYDGSLSWTEKHKCPKCNEEFEFENGT